MHCRRSTSQSSFIISQGLLLIELLQVWHLRLTVHCLSDSGNLLDCACLAGIVALKHFRKPEVEVVGEDVTVVRLSL